MSHTYGSCLYHFVISTRGHEKWIDPLWRDRLWEYMGGIARENGMKALGIGGTADHAHLLLMAPPSVAPAKAIQLVKGGSSKWVHETFAQSRDFAWQDSYGVFTVGFSQIPATQDYIAGQENHHRMKTFEEEYRAFLEKHKITYDEKYLFG